MLFEEKKHGKALDWTLQIISGLSAAVLFVTGAALFGGVLGAELEAWGYPPGVPAMIGILEMSGAIALLFRRTAGWSALGLMVIMAGAIWNHAVTGSGMEAIPAAVMLVVLAGIAWGRGLPMRTIGRPLPSTEPSPAAGPGPAGPPRGAIPAA